MARHKLTEKQKQDYVQKRPGNCPYCGSTNIEGDSYDYEGETVMQDISCLDCEAEWTDVYTLTSVEER